MSLVWEPDGCSTFLITACLHIYEKKEEIWLVPMTEAPKPIEKSNKQRGNTKTPSKTSITQRLRTVSLGKDSHPIVVVNQFTGSQTSH